MGVLFPGIAQGNYFKEKSVAATKVSKIYTLTIESSKLPHNLLPCQVGHDSGIHVH